jgi:hypothetical protein
MCIMSCRHVCCEKVQSLRAELAKTEQKIAKEARLLLRMQWEIAYRSSVLATIEQSPTTPS